jgi:hypothetical protein
MCVNKLGKAGTQESPLVLVFLGIYYILWIPTFPGLAELWYSRRGKKREPYWCMELWALSMLGLELLTLFSQWFPSFWAVAIAFYGLAAVTAGFLRDVLYSLNRHRDPEGGYISIRNRPRWVILAFLGVLQIPTCFAILFMEWGCEFNPAICEPLTAFYLSLVTFTTVGYGEIAPKTIIAQGLVTAELLFFLVFVGLRLPLAVSVMRVKELSEPDAP